MTSDDFKAWRKAMGFTQAKAAEALGVSKPTVENYDKGVRRENGEPVIIPRTVALACAALFHKLEPWSQE